MRYRPTPLNIASGIIIGFAIYVGFNPGPMGFGILGLIYLLPIGLFSLLIDYGIQKLSKKYIWTFSIEAFIVVFLILGYSWTERTKTLIIPDNIDSDYIVTIYGVENAQKLPVTILSWEYKLEVPENGILLTSSDPGLDLPKTKMYTKSGIDLQNKNDSIDINFGRVRTASIECSGRHYKYQAWKIDKGGTIGYSSKDLDSLQVRLERYLCNEKAMQVTSSKRHS